MRGKRKTTFSSFFVQITGKGTVPAVVAAGLDVNGHPARGEDGLDFPLKFIDE